MPAARLLWLQDNSRRPFSRILDLTMQTLKHIFVIAAFLLTGGFAWADEPLEPELYEEVVRIPVPPVSADEAPASIIVTHFRPQGPGPFPVLVLSHGNPPSAADRVKVGRFRQMPQIREFIQRGYAVIVPVRRGYGATGGDFAEGYKNCTTTEYLHAGLEAARDLLATVDFARTLPFVRSDRLILAGQSAGGFASLAAASLRPQGLVAVLNFSGGRGGNPKKSPGVPCGPEAMAEVFAHFGKTTQAPALFHYVENDRFFGPEFTRSWFDAFEHAGGKGTFVLQPAYGRDGHGMFYSSSAIGIWTPAMDSFLKEIK